MLQKNINEDHLLLLIYNGKAVEITKLNIDKHFEKETILFSKLCEGDNDNIPQIINTIIKILKPKLPNKTFNYCKELDKAYQSVYVNVEAGIEEITKKRNLVYLNQRNARIENREFNLSENIRDLKNYIRTTLELWFKVFDIEFAYEKAKKVNKMLVYSHRISGWSSPEYKITENLKQQVKTNFGYGSVSYFYSLLTFKNIQITPLSEWTDYRYSNFSEVIRYTKSFKSKTPIIDDKGSLKYFKTKIENSYWLYALEFTKNAANLSSTNEKEFIEKYIISECETMVNGLEIFYNETEFDFIDENKLNLEHENIVRHRVDINGYELIDFRTEKIIGALDFLKKLNEYNSIISTNHYTDKIIALNKKFIPNVFNALKNQKEELTEAKKHYNTFILSHNQLLEKSKFYQNEKLKLKSEFESQYGKEYSYFILLLDKSYADLKYHINKVKLHSDNIEKLDKYILKYNEIVK